MNKLKLSLLAIAAVFALSVPSAYAWGCGPGVKCPTTTTSTTIVETTTTTTEATTTTVPETTTTSTTTTVPTELAPPVYEEKTPIKFTG